MDSLFKYVDSASEIGSSEEEYFDSLYGGEACSIISSLEDSIKKIDNFLLFERQFFHGDVVRLASDSKQQSGKVVNVEMTVNLETTDGFKLENVNCRNLQRIRSVSVDDYVILGPWFGKVDKVIDRLTVLFDDGTKCHLIADGTEKIITLSTDIVEDSAYPFYPGQRIQVEPPSVTKLTHWLCGRSRDKKTHGTIVDVDAGVAYVDWLFCAVMNVEKGHSPPTLQDPVNLTVLSAFPHASWQLGDWCMFTVEHSFVHPFGSSVMTREQNVSEHLAQNGDASSSFLQVSVITGTKTKIDVLWQDGSQSRGLDAHLLVPVNVVDPHDFWPHTIVLEKGTPNGSQVPNSHRWGIVKNVDPKERTTQVKWCKLSLVEEEQIEETVSSYELIEHTDFSFSHGEEVFRMTSFAIGDLDEYHVGDQSCKFLSCFGTVAGFENGYLEVKWADGETSKVAPYEVYKVHNCKEGSEFTLSDENAQLAIEEPSNSFPGLKLKDISGHHNENVDSSSVNSFSHVVGILSSVTTGILGSHSAPDTKACNESTSECRNNYSQLPKEELLELCNLNLCTKTLEEDDSEACPHAIEVNLATFPSSSKNQRDFKQFDMVSDCSDHQFIKESRMEVHSSQTKRSWLKKIHKEWSILHKDLPETIYVRAHEDRIDLLRAAIVGADGTPYHDGLFFFDIYLPPQYPYEPPMVHYNSGGLRINPNLYESGKVCLSLLNTWTGSPSEVWNPESSTILQVLLSLQALVLNDKPYFNEAGYDSQIGKPEGENNSVSYNENAFLVSCKSMLYILHKPPKNFEDFVMDHFNGRCRKILLACEGYMGGAPLGHPFNYKSCEMGNQRSTSTGFKIMLSKLYPLLVEAFTQKGFICHDSLELGM